MTTGQSTDDQAATLLSMIRGYWISQAICVAARLGLADLTGDASRSCADLADATGWPERSIFRLLRALASVGIFTHVGDSHFALTPLGRPLRSDATNSVLANAIVTGEVYLPVWNALFPSLQHERAEFPQMFGADFFPYLAANPALGASFQESMVHLNAGVTASIPAAYDFSVFRRVADVGGGKGSLLVEILKANPKVNGVLFDLPSVIELARENLAASGVANRCDLVGGDFFAGVVSGCDAYLLRWILHDHGDDPAIRILRSCREAMPPEARLLVIENVIEPGDGPQSWATKFHDLHMQILFGGRERTESEFRSLFAAAGFELRRVISTASPMSILEGIPVPIVE